MAVNEFFEIPNPKGYGERVSMPGYSGVFDNVLAALSAGGFVGDGFVVKAQPGTTASLTLVGSADKPQIKVTFSPKPTVQVVKGISLFKFRYDTTIEGVLATREGFSILVDKAPDPSFEVTS